MFTFLRLCSSLPDLFLISVLTVSFHCCPWDLKEDRRASLSPRADCKLSAGGCAGGVDL